MSRLAAMINNMVGRCAMKKMSNAELEEQLWTEIDGARHPLSPPFRAASIERVTIHYKDEHIADIEYWFTNGLGLLFEHIGGDSSTVDSGVIPSGDSDYSFFVVDISHRQWEEFRIAVYFDDWEELHLLFYAASVRQLSQ